MMGMRSAGSATRDCWMLFVGELDGELDGALDGALEGATVGALVGALVGFPEREMVELDDAGNADCPLDTSVT